MLKVFGKNIFKGGWPSLQFQYCILRYLCSRTRLLTQNSSWYRYHSKALDLIYWKKSQKFEKSTLKFFWDSAKLFPKIIIISELSLSPAPANFDSSKEPLTDTTNGRSGYSDSLNSWNETMNGKVELFKIPKWDLFNPSAIVRSFKYFPS